MKKYTYPMVVGFNTDTGEFNGWLPDLMILAHGATMGEMNADARFIMREFFGTIHEHDISVPAVTPIAELQKKWTAENGYEVVNFEVTVY